MDPRLTALLDELSKIGASRQRMAIPQSRAGRRPMSVETMLRRDNEGTLFKDPNSKSGLLKHDDLRRLAKEKKDADPRPTSIKEAATRAVKEWRAAQSADPGFASQIAQGSGQLGLKPRYLENISGGGMEAGVDKMMGSAGPANVPAAPSFQQRLDAHKATKQQIGLGGAPLTPAHLQSPVGRMMVGGQGPQAPAAAPAPNESGYLARKIYKPDSPIATGQDTSNLLALKKQYTDTARGLSPEAKQMVPAMYGHRELQTPGGLRHTSDHEYVPKMKNLESSANPVAHAERVQRVVAQPMAARGMPMGDIARTFDAGELGGKMLAGNVSNVGLTAQGPKIVDFLPSGDSSPVSVTQHGLHDYAQPAPSGGARSTTQYGDHNVNQLRRDVFRPPAPAPKPAPAVKGGGNWSWGGGIAPAPKPATGPMGTTIMPKPAASTAVKALSTARTIPAVPKALAGGGSLLARASKAVAPLAKAIHP